MRRRRKSSEGRRRLIKWLGKPWIIGKLEISLRNPLGKMVFSSTKRGFGLGQINGKIHKGKKTKTTPVNIWLNLRED